MVMNVARTTACTLSTMCAKCRCCLPRFPRRFYLLVLLMSLSLIHPPGGLAQGLAIDNQEDKVGATIDIAIRVDRAPNAVNAFGFDLIYDTKVLQYVGRFQRGDLISSFSFFNVNEPVPGRVRVGGGTMAQPIQAGSSGSLVILRFVVRSLGETALTIESMVDGMATWSLQAGRFKAVGASATSQ